MKNFVIHDYDEKKIEDFIKKHDCPYLKAIKLLNDGDISELNLLRQDNKGFSYYSFSTEKSWYICGCGERVDLF